MMARNKLLYNEVIKLRKKGKSYNQISEVLSVPKSTVSDWLSGKKWSDTLKVQLVEENRTRSSNFLIRINRLKHKQTLERHKIFQDAARKEYGSLKQNKLFLIGLAIYWGEGEKDNKNGRVSLVNSDIKMLKVIVNFYRKVLSVPEGKLRAGIFTYEDINKEGALNYWSNNLKIDKKQFIKTQVLPSRSKLTRNKVLYGMCSVYFSNIERCIKIKEWTSMLANDMRV